MESYLKNIDIVQILFREVELLRSNPEVIKNTFFRNYITLVTFLTEAKKRKLISLKTDPGHAAEFLFSQISYKIQNDKLSYVFLGKTLSDPCSLYNTDCR